MILWNSNNVLARGVLVIHYAFIPYAYNLTEYISVCIFLCVLLVGWYGVV